MTHGVSADGEQRSDADGTSLHGDLLGPDGTAGRSHPRAGAVTRASRAQGDRDGAWRSSCATREARTGRRAQGAAGLRVDVPLRPALMRAKVGRDRLAPCLGWPRFAQEELALLPAERELGEEDREYWPWLWDPAAWRRGGGGKTAPGRFAKRSGHPVRSWVRISRIVIARFAAS